MRLQHTTVGFECVCASVCVSHHLALLRVMVRSREAARVRETENVPLSEVKLLCLFAISISSYSRHRAPF